MKLHGRGHRALFVLLLASSLGGCVTPMDFPAEPRGALTENGADYGDAMAYVEAARSQLNAKLKDVDKLDALTKVSVGGGLAGAAIAAAFGGGRKVVLGGLTVAALGYSASSSTDPHILGEVLNAGLGNLDCIESAGAQANEALAGQRYVMTQRRSVVSVPLGKLKQDLQAAVSDPGVTADEIRTARQSEAAGDAVLGAIDRYLTHNPAATPMVLAARRTIAAVNQEMRERSPSVGTIFKSGSIFATVYSGGVGVEAAAVAGAAKITPTAVSHSLISPLSAALVDDQNSLQAALKSVGDLAPSAINIATVSGCQTQFAAEQPMALAFTNPVELTPTGSPKNLSVVSNAAIWPRWLSGAPSDVDVSQSMGVVTLTPQAGEKEGSYKLQLVDYSGHSTEDIVVNVHAVPTKVADPVAPKETPTPANSLSAGQQTNNGNTIKQPPPPVGH